MRWGWQWFLHFSRGTIRLRALCSALFRPLLPAGRELL